MKLFERWKINWRVLGAFSLLIFAGGNLTASADDSQPISAKTDLTTLSLTELSGLNTVVTSSSKKAESLRDATSAIFVITQDDIRRSGAKTVPDLLIMVPGIQVARQSADSWAISARGFNANYNNKMLVLIDGRSVYDPTRGGVNWNEQDVMLEDIDHIEVIRGPGGTLWGSNAVNGVINIITKDSKVTQGLYLSANAGDPLYDAGVQNNSALNGGSAVRYGGKLGDDLFYRVFGQFNNTNPSENPTPGTAGLGSTWNDESYDFRAGLRSDLHKGDDDFTFEAEGQKGYFNYASLNTSASPIVNPATMLGYNDINTDIDQNAHILGQWTRNFKDDSQIQALAYYDYNNLTTTQDSSVVNIGQLDVELQHRFHLGSWNEITWGGSWHNTSDQFYNPVYWYYSPANQNINIYGGFAQDRLTLVSDRLYLTAGSKIENNPYTGTEFEPSGRILFTPDDTNSFWAAVSRAVRIPTQTGESAYIYLQGIPANAYGPGVPGSNVFAALVPNTSLLSETLISYELGYRTNPTKDTSVDIAAFLNHYEQLVTLPSVYGTVPSPAGGVIGSPVLGVPYYQETNTGMGEIYGVETSVKWDPATNLHLAVAYTYQTYDQNMINSSSTNLGAPPPHNLASARLTYEPVKGLELNNNFYYTDATYLYDGANGNTSIVPSYVQWNLGADWKATDNWEFSLWGMDLEGAHTETLPSFGVQSTTVVPSVYGQVALRFL